MPICYVVRDAGDEYVKADGGRTPCGESATEFATYDEAWAAMERATDRVFARQDGQWDRIVSCAVDELPD